MPCLCLISSNFFLYFRFAQKHLPALEGLEHAKRIRRVPNAGRKHLSQKSIKTKNNLSNR